METAFVKLQDPSALTKYVVIATGETVIEDPLPIDIGFPDIYHTQFAPIPKLPPTTVKVVESGIHIGFWLGLIEVAAIDDVSTVTVVDTHDVV